MSKHTPGPWEVAEEDGEMFVQVVNQPASCHPMFDRYRIIHGYVGGDPTENPTADLGTPEGNARLIASSPDLVIELRQAIIQMEMAAECIEKGRYDEALLHVSSLMRSKKKVLAKATGESP
ncbi:hypothetical protein [Stenotrophomonas phage SOVA965]